VLTLELYVIYVSFGKMCCENNTINIATI